MPGEIMNSPDIKKIYVTDLAEGVHEDELLAVCRTYGKVNKIWVATASPRYAVVEFSRAKDAADIVNDLNGEIFCGRKLGVELYTTKIPKSRPPRSPSRENKSSGNAATRDSKKERRTPIQYRRRSSIESDRSSSKAFRSEKRKESPIQYSKRRYLKTESVSPEKCSPPRKIKKRSPSMKSSECDYDSPLTDLYSSTSARYDAKVSHPSRSRGSDITSYSKSRYSRSPKRYDSRKASPAEMSHSRRDSRDPYARNAYSPPPPTKRYVARSPSPQPYSVAAKRNTDYHSPYAREVRAVPEVDYRRDSSRTGRDMYPESYPHKSPTYERKGANPFGGRSYSNRDMSTCRSHVESSMYYSPKPRIEGGGGDSYGRDSHGFNSGPSRGSRPSFGNRRGARSNTEWGGARNAQQSNPFSNKRSASPSKDWDSQPPRPTTPHNKTKFEAVHSEEDWDSDGGKGATTTKPSNDYKTDSWNSATTSRNAYPEKDWDCNQTQTAFKPSNNVVDEENWDCLPSATVHNSKPRREEIDGNGNLNKCNTITDENWECLPRERHTSKPNNINPVNDEENWDVDEESPQQIPVKNCDNKESPLSQAKQNVNDVDSILDILDEIDWSSMPCNSQSTSSKPSAGNIATTTEEFNWQNIPERMSLSKIRGTTPDDGGWDEIPTATPNYGHNARRSTIYDQRDDDNSFNTKPIHQHRESYSRAKTPDRSNYRDVARNRSRYDNNRESRCNNDNNNAAMRDITPPANQDFDDSWKTESSRTSKYAQNKNRGVTPDGGDWDD